MIAGVGSALTGPALKLVMEMISSSRLLPARIEGPVAWIYP